MSLPKFLFLLQRSQTRVVRRPDHLVSTTRRLSAAAAASAGRLLFRSSMSSVGLAYPGYDPNQPSCVCYPDDVVALRDDRFQLHLEAKSLVESGDLDEASRLVKNACTKAVAAPLTADRSWSDALKFIENLKVACGSSTTISAIPHHRRYLLDEAYWKWNSAIEILSNGPDATRKLIHASVVALKSEIWYNSEEDADRLSKAYKCSGDALQSLETLKSMTSGATTEKLFATAELARSKLKEVIRDLNNANAAFYCFPCVFTCNDLILSFIRAGRTTEAIGLYYFFFLEMKLVPNAVSFRCLVNAHCDNGAVDTAIHLCRQIITTSSVPLWPTPTTYHLIIMALVNAGRIYDAVDFLREMLDWGDRPDPEVRYFLVKAFMRDGNMHEVRILLDADFRYI